MAADNVTLGSFTGQGRRPERVSATITFGTVFGRGWWHRSKMIIDNQIEPMEPNENEVVATTPWSVLDEEDKRYENFYHYVKQPFWHGEAPKPSILYPGYLERGKKIWFSPGLDSNGEHYYCNLTVREYAELDRRRLINESHRRFTSMKKYWL